MINNTIQPLKLKESTMESTYFRVSVIVPVYNAGKWLRNAVESSIHMDDVGEVVLVEDGSTDGSLALCLELQQLYAKIRVIRHPGGANRGAGESRNLGIREACFPFVAFLDSDDIYLPNRFDAAREILMTNGSVDGVYDVVWRKDVDTGKKSIHGIQERIDPEDLFNRLAHGKYFHTNGITVRKKIFDEAGYFEQKYFPHEDNMMWMSMAFHGKLVGGNLEDPVSDHYVHNENSMQHAGVLTRYRLWKGAFVTYVFKPVSMRTKLNLFERFMKFGLKSLMVHAGIYKRRN